MSSAAAAVEALIGEPAMLIGSSWVKASELRPVLNPADESVVAAVPEGAAEDAERALEAARRAQPGWSRRSGPQRGAVLRSVAAAIRARADELARVIVAEQGKTITEARGEAESTAAFFEYFAAYERAQVGTLWAADEPGEELSIREIPYGMMPATTP